MIRRASILLLLAAAAGAAPADDYFELGLDYLKKGFFARARRAFAESLVRAPGQPVPIAFSGVAAAAEGRSPAVCARLLRTAIAKLPAGTALRIDLNRVLPSARALALLKADYARLESRARDRIDALTVLAFLEVHDGDRQSAALARLRKLRPRDPYVTALTPPSS